MPSIKIDVDIYFEVWCEECGYGLCRLTTVKGEQVTVESCPECLAKACTNGYNDGYEKGLLHKVLGGE